MSGANPLNPNAFPVVGFARIGNGDKEIHLAHTGMTLRDWFAGQALTTMAGRIHDAQHECQPMDRIARDAYELADAMLKARGES